MRSAEERFWSHVDKSRECWLWTASTASGGYGKFWYEGKLMNASRVAYILTNGPIPDNVHVLHRCDNPPCCNPTHLIAGSPRDNAQDMWSKGRASAPPRNNNFTPEEVVDIWRRCKGGEKQKDIAEVYNVPRNTISNLMCGKTYAHITAPLDFDQGMG